MFRTLVIMLACVTAFAFAAPVSAQMSDESSMSQKQERMYMKKKSKNKMSRKHSMKKNQGMRSGRMMQGNQMRGASRSQIMNEPLDKTNNVD